MSDDRKKSSVATSLVVALVGLAALAGLCFCGGFGLFFLRARSVVPPAGAPGRPIAPNESMLKRFVDDVIGVPPAPVVPAPPVPVAPQSAPMRSEPPASATGPAEAEAQSQGEP